MKENREFDMLENADDRTVEFLSEVPVLTKEEKERILAMSKKKLDKMNRERHIKVNDDDYQVSGVERYNKPKWQTFASIAACLLLVGGITGTFMTLNKVKPSGNDPLDSASSSVSATYAEEDLSKIAGELLDRYDGISRTSYGKPVIIELDPNDTQSIDIYEGNYAEYQRVTGEFDSQDKLMKYFRDTLTDNLLLDYEAQCFKYKGSEPIFKEIDGKLYYRASDNPTKITHIEYSVENYSGSSFDIKVVDTIGGYNGDITGTKTGTFHVVSDDGKWKLSSFVYLDNERTIEPQTEAPTSLEDTEFEAAVAQKTLGGLEYRDGILSGCADIETDPDDMLSFPMSGGGTATYHRVTRTFSNLEDVREFVDCCYAGPELTSYFSFLYEDSNDDLPMFKEIDGKLYYRDYVRQQRYHFTGEPIVIAKNGESFDVLIDNEVPGGTEKLQATIVIVNDTYTVGYIGYPKSESTAVSYDALAVVRQAQDNMNNAIGAACGNIAADKTDQLTKDADGPGNVCIYSKVNDFKSISAIKNLISELTCGIFETNLIEENLMPRVETVNPLYIEEGGSLYVRSDADRGRPDFDFTDEISITESTDKKITAHTAYVYAGAKHEIIIHLELEDGIWKISGYEYA